MVTPH